MSATQEFPLPDDWQIEYDKLSLHGRVVFNRIYAMWALMNVITYSYVGISLQYNPLSNGVAFENLTDAYERLYGLCQWMLGLDGAGLVLDVNSAHFLYHHVMFQTWPPSQHAFYETRAAVLLKFVGWDTINWVPASWPN